MKLFHAILGAIVAFMCILLGYSLALKSPEKVAAKPLPKIEQREIPVLHKPLLPVVVYTPWPEPERMDISTNIGAARWLSKYPSCNLRGFILARRADGQSIAMVSGELLVESLQPELFKKLKWEKFNNGETAIARIDSNPVESKGLPLVGKLEKGKDVKVITAFFTVTSEPTVATWSGMAKPTKYPRTYSFEADTESAVRMSVKLVGTGVYDDDKVVGIITKSAAVIQEDQEVSLMLIEVLPIPE